MSHQDHSGHSRSHPDHSGHSRSHSRSYSRSHQDHTGHSRSHQDHTSHSRSQSRSHQDRTSHSRSQSRSHQNHTGHSSHIRTLPGQAVMYQTGHSDTELSCYRHSDIRVTHPYTESTSTTLWEVNNSENSTPLTTNRGVHRMTSNVESQKLEDTCSYQFTRADHHVVVSVACKKKEPNCVLCQFIEVEIGTLDWRVDNMSLALRGEDLGQTLSRRILTTQPGCVGQGQVDSSCAVLTDIGNQAPSECIMTNSAGIEPKEDRESVKGCKPERITVLVKYG